MSLCRGLGRLKDGLRGLPGREKNWKEWRVGRRIDEAGDG
jgi:hypothetical protein